MLLFYDLETTSLDIDNTEILEIGCVAAYPSGEVVEEFEVKVKPEDDTDIWLDSHYDPVIWGREAVSLTRALQDLILFAREYTEYEKVSARGNLYYVANSAGWNCSHFDDDILRRCVQSVDLFLPFNLPSLDLLSCWRTLCCLRDSSFNSYTGRLSELGDYYGVATGKAHTALDDAKTVAALFPYIMSELHEVTRYCCGGSNA